MSFTRFFHLISYLQYPLMLMALYYAIHPYLGGLDAIKDNFNLVLADINKMLVWMGLGISFSTLQDTTRTQNELSRKIWEDPKKGRRMIILIMVSIAIILAYGVFGYFISDSATLQEVSFGAIVLGIGMMGMLKAASEMYENHRRDRVA